MMTQQDKFVRIAALMSASLERELTEDERARLDGLLNTPELRQMAAQWEQEPGRGMERYAKYSAQEAFVQFRKRTRSEKRVLAARSEQSKRKRMMIWSAAALVALVVGVGLMSRRNSVEDRPIVAATERATLYTAWGDVVELGSRDTTIHLASIAGNNVSFDSANPDNSLSAGAFPSTTAAARNRMVVPRGGIFFVNLCDGTRVALNADSELSFPSSFESASERRVSLKGEGYFVVAKDPAKPFIVTTPDGLDVRVLGTRFNVQAYAGDAQTQVTLLQGSVRVHHGGSDVQLANGWQAVLDRGSGALAKRWANNAAETIGWSQGLFYFEAASLGEIFASLERWYDVEFDYRGVDIASEGLFSMRINCTADLSDILALLHDVTGLNATVHGHTIVISG